MKRTVLIITGVLVMLGILGLFGCNKQKPESPADTDGSVIEISVKNEVGDADVWVIPNTEENRKTTVWGKATVSTVGTDSVNVKIAGDTESYLVRIIDGDGMFYSADDVKIAEHQSLVIRTDDEGITTLFVYGEDGSTVGEYEMFAGRL